MIQLEGFCKNYGAFCAVQDVSFTAYPGEVTALIGENGAGKSTILKGVAAFHFPSAGTVKVCAVSSADSPEEVRRLVGYVPEEAVFPGAFTAREHLHFLAETLELPTLRCVEAAALCDLGEDMLDKKCRNLSRGYRQRLSLAAALLSNPPVLVLDEPTAALDPAQAYRFRSAVARLSTEKTVLLSTHNLPEAEALCRRLNIVHRGRLVFSGTQEELRQKTGGLPLEEAFLQMTSGI